MWRLQGSGAIFVCWVSVKLRLLFTAGPCWQVVSARCAVWIFIDLWNLRPQNACSLSFLRPALKICVKNADFCVNANPAKWLAIEQHKPSVRLDGFCMPSQCIQRLHQCLSVTGMWHQAGLHFFSNVDPITKVTCMLRPQCLNSFQSMWPINTGRGSSLGPTKPCSVA